MKISEMMARMIGIKISVTPSTVYASLNGFSVTCGYKFTDGDVSAAIESAIAQLYEATK
jgi:hypothetical protein